MISATRHHSGVSTWYGLRHPVINPTNKKCSTIPIFSLGNQYSRNFHLYVPGQCFQSHLSLVAMQIVAWVFCCIVNWFSISCTLLVVEFALKQFILVCILPSHSRCHQDRLEANGCGSWYVRTSPSEGSVC